VVKAMEGVKEEVEDPRERQALDALAKEGAAKVAAVQRRIFESQLWSRMVGDFLRGGGDPAVAEVVGDELLRAWKERFGSIYEPLDLGSTAIAERAKGTA